MKIEQKFITIKELSKNFIDDEEHGCLGFDKKLNIRPKYQREFVYNDEKKRKVIDTVIKGFPLNIMYWSKNEDGTYEVIDGQQRTISIAQFLNNMFSVKINGNEMKYSNIKSMDKELAEKIGNYKITVYICEGSESEKLDWFRTINIAGVTLNDQELRNAVYTGSWLSDAKKYFSKNNCPAYILSQANSEKYLTGSPIKQELLETAILWISEYKNKKIIKNTSDIISAYMSEHQNDKDAKELKDHFETVIKWIKKNFKVYRKEMASIKWGRLYSLFNENTYNADDLEDKISELMEDEDVTNKKGIYEYVLEYFGKNSDGTNMVAKENHLSIRLFTDRVVREVYEKQTSDGRSKNISNCPLCAANGSNKIFKLTEMEADHIIPWSKGGNTTKDNCQLLCKAHNNNKSNN